MSKRPCGEPIALPIKTHRVNGLSSNKRGIALHFGTPTQRVIMKMHSYFNAVVVATAPINSDNCPSDHAPKRCLWNKGGLYDPGASRTYIKATADSYGGDKGHYAKIGHGKDLLTVNTNAQLDSFPIALESGFTDVWAQNPLIGLHMNSDLVNVLHKTKTIPSRVFALDMGRTGMRESDGELLFGGYNKKRLRGKFEDMEEFKVTEEQCPYQITFRKITMISETGERVLMMGESSSQSMRACIQPLYPMITLPNPIFEVMNEKLGRPYDTFGNTNRVRSDIHMWAYHNPRDKNFKGDLEFELNSGFKITIPSEQLLTDYKEVTDDGNVRVDTSRTTLLINDLADVNKNDMPILGAPFLSSIYFAADLDRKKFWIGNTAYASAGDNDYALLPGAAVETCTVPGSNVKPPTTTKKSEPTTTSRNGSSNPQPTRRITTDKESRPTETGVVRRPVQTGGVDGDDETEDEGEDGGGDDEIPDGNGGWDSGDIDDSNSSGGSIDIPSGGGSWNTDGDTRFNDNDGTLGNQRGSDRNDNGNQLGASGDDKKPSGAVIGGAVGGSLTILLLLAFLLFFFRRRNARRRDTLITTSEFEGKSMGYTPTTSTTLNNPLSAGVGAGFFEPNKMQKAYPSHLAPAPIPPVAAARYEISSKNSMYELASSTNSQYGPTRDGQPIYEVSAVPTATEIDGREAFTGYGTATTRPDFYSLTQTPGVFSTVGLGQNGTFASSNVIPQTSGSSVGIGRTPTGYIPELDASQIPGYRGKPKVYRSDF